MKVSLLLLLGTSVAALAQAPTPVLPSQPIRPPGQSAPVAPAGDLTRFDLDFRGGTPAELVEALDKALGKEINVIVVDSASKVRLPPVRVRNATVNDVFTAIATASQREVAVPSGGNTIQYKLVQCRFTPTGATITDDTVWSFVSNETDLHEQSLRLSQPKRELAHFQLRDYLSDSVNVEDITTAIRTGWEMIAVKNPPDLKFHKETGILIAAGDPKLLEQIPLVLQQLARDPSAGSSVPAPPRVPKVVTPPKPAPLQ
jgi:hypothetical protein